MREISLALAQKPEICGASLPDPLGLQLAPCRATVRPERNGRLLSKYCVRLAPKPSSLVPLLYRPRLHQTPNLTLKQEKLHLWHREENGADKVRCMGSTFCITWYYSLAFRLLVGYNKTEENIKKEQVEHDGYAQLARVFI